MWILVNNSIFLSLSLFRMSVRFSYDDFINDYHERNLEAFPPLFSKRGNVRLVLFHP